jgi:hypothetical protein
VESRSGEALRLVTVAPPRPEDGGVAVIEAVERYQGSTLVYRGRFEEVESVGGYRFPKRVLLESPARKIAVSVQYEDIEVNVPLDDGAFALPEENGR